MKARFIASMVEQHPDAELVIQGNPFDEYSTSSPYVAHFYAKGSVVEEARGEDFSELIDYDGVALVDIIFIA